MIEHDWLDWLRLILYILFAIFILGFGIWYYFWGQYAHLGAF